MREEPAPSTREMGSNSRALAVQPTRIQCALRPRKTDSIHHHHSEGVVHRSCCLNSSTFAVSKVTSRRWWCTESLFPRPLSTTDPRPRTASCAKESTPSSRTSRPRSWAWRAEEVERGIPAKAPNVPLPCQRATSVPVEGPCVRARFRETL